MTLGERIAAEARTYLDTPFRHAGRDRSGLDCGGLLAVVWWGVGLQAQDFPPYSKQEAPALLVAGIERYCRRIEELPEPGDVLLVRIKGLPMHCGIYLGGNQLIHASDSPGVERVVVRRFEPERHRHVATTYRWRGAD